MQSGSLISPVEDLTTTLKGAGIMWGGIDPKPENIFVCKGIINIMGLECLLVEECDLPPMIYFDPEYWREIQPPMNIEEIIEESIHVLV